MLRTASRVAYCSSLHNAQYVRYLASNAANTQDSEEGSISEDVIKAGLWHVVEDGVYRDANTRPPPSAFTVHTIGRAELDAVLLQKTFFLSKSDRKLAAKFKEIEESKWEEIAKAKRARYEKYKSQRGPRPIAEEAQEEADLKKVEELIRKTEAFESEEQMMNEEYLGEVLESMNKVAWDPDTVFPGLWGLTQPYMLESIAADRWEKQARPAVWTEGEARLERVQGRRRAMAMLEKARLIPPVDSVLWESDDVEQWHHWSKTGELLDDTRIDWQGLKFEDAANLGAELLAKDFFPGTTNEQDSAQAWAARRARIKELQSRIKAPQREFPVQISTRTYWEPQTASDEKRRWRERKVILRVHVPWLELPSHAKSRFIELLGKRFNKQTKTAQIVSHKYRTKDENKLNCLLLMRSLISEAYKAEPDYVMVNENAEDIRRAHSAALNENLEKVLSDGKLHLFRFSNAQ